MGYVLVFLLGLTVGAICAFLIFESGRLRLAAQKREQENLAKQQKEASQTIQQRQEVLASLETRLKAERAELDARAVSYGELHNENLILKRDLCNVDVTLRKLQLDRDLQRQKQQQLDDRAKELGGHYLKDNIKWIGMSLTPNNFALSKERLLKVIEWCREIGFDVPPADEAAQVENLKQEYEKVVRAAIEREEQARIKAQIREEQKLQREVERELQQLDRERAAIQAALDKALAEAKDEHGAEVERLKARLAEAEAKSQRAMSQAQMTKAGHIYVISNIGSFGDGVFKIGMTRRLEPMDRVKELGDASVPFPFDVHMMISCQDAPSLENALHRTLHKMRLNKTNPRKEFFKTDIEAIRKIVLDHHGEVQYVADPEALQYRQSLSMSDEDEEFIESVYDKIEEENPAPAAED